MRAEIDTERLPEQEAAELRSLPDKIRAAAKGTGPGGPKYDAFEYLFTVETEGKREQLTLTEGQIPSDVRAVADRLIIAEARRKKGR